MPAPNPKRGRHHHHYATRDRPVPDDPFDQVTAPLPDWMADALCAEPAYRAVTFFPERGESTGPAKAVCARCLVRPDCLDHALTVKAGSLPLPGVWGGTSDRDRKRLRQVVSITARTRSDPAEAGPLDPDARRATA